VSLKRFLRIIIEIAFGTFLINRNVVILQKTHIMNLSQEDWVNQLAADENAVILDVRTEDEFNDGYIENAVNIDINKGQGFIYEIEELDKNKNYYVYCRSGARSAKACQVMNELGINNAYNLLGGILDWEGETINP